RDGRAAARPHARRRPRPILRGGGAPRGAPATRQVGSPGSPAHALAALFLGVPQRRDAPGVPWGILGGAEAWGGAAWPVVDRRRDGAYPHGPRRDRGGRTARARRPPRPAGAGRARHARRSIRRGPAPARRLPASAPRRPRRLECSATAGSLRDGRRRGRAVARPSAGPRAPPRRVAPPPRLPLGPPLP